MVNLDLTVNEINLILQALGQAPYTHVFEIVAKIQAQANPQVAALPKEEVE